VNEIHCCIAGSGPAGAVLGFLLARAGIPVTVLEKHADFLRDFRGDTIHPSTLQILEDLGLADRFLSELPHSEVTEMQFRFPDDRVLTFNFDRLPTHFKFLAFVPQWDFLEFITREASRYSTFTLLREAEVEDLLFDDGRVVGVRYRQQGASHELRSLLTVGADGRTSVVRSAAALPLVETSPPMDVLWFRVSRKPTDGNPFEFRFGPARLFGMINRRDYWQVADVIPKGAFERVRAEGLEAFRRTFAESEPELADRADELQEWDQIKLLSVRADRLERWYRPGLLCIGDAAHAMSPVGGVGINVAIQDAVQAANLLWRPLSCGEVGVGQLARVQRRRELSVRVTQALQGALQKLLVRPALVAPLGGAFPVSPLVTLAIRLPVLTDVAARIVALGLVPVRVRAPEDRQALRMK
jgi:2-polyprenyl-6-methoxyphenol hydroxylase-like FAD-dependent oxidoreductase